MSGRPWAWALGMLLVTSAAGTAVADDNAHKKSGGDSGGRSASAGARHSGGGSSRSGGEVRSGGDRVSRESSVSDPGPRGGDRSRGSSASRRETTGAESRQPNPGTGHGVRGGGRGYSGSSFYFRPYYRSSYYRPYYGWYGVPYYD